MMVLLAITCMLVYLMFTNYRQWVQISAEKAEIKRQTDELRQSSNDLTRFARLYVITGKKVYADNYRQVLAIRDGTAPRPRNYEHIYWDLTPEMRALTHPPTEHDALITRLENLPLIESESDLLIASLDNSDHLAALELSVFVNLEKTEDNLQQLLFSDNYQLRKNNVMLPLDNLLNSLDWRYAEEIGGIRLNIADVFTFFAVVLILFISFTVLVLIYARQKILRPVRSLINNIHHIQKGEDMEKRVFYDDEIGLLARQFYSMKAQMDLSYENLKTVSFTDSLTGLYNRHYFFQAAQQQMQSAARHGHPMCIMMSDIDHFKSINDTHGHLIGDEALKHIAAKISGSVRESDICSRFGGEEFIVLFNNSNLVDSMTICNKIRINIENSPCQHDGVTVPMTISIGVAAISGIGDGDINKALDRADKALYEAKNGGRNRVCRG